jgi:hypothetical protein
MRSVRHAIVTLAAAAAAACSSTPASQVAVQEGDPAVLNRDCKLLGTVNGRSMFGGISDETKTTAAMSDAREKAAKMGATHIVFIASDNSGAFGSGHAAARAYRCDKTS